MSDIDVEPPPMGRDGEDEDAEEEEENEEEREERERRDRDDNKDDDDYDDDEERENNDGNGGESAEEPTEEQTEEQAVEADNRKNEKQAFDLIENEDGAMVEVRVTTGETEQEKLIAMTKRVAALEKELEDSKTGVSESDDAAPELETVWWQSHPEFPPEWQSLPRCTINPKMNEEKLDTAVRHFI